MLSYEFVRSSRANSNELHLLNIIDSFSGECHLSVGQLSAMVGKSRRTVKRILQSLREKGMICVRYGLYKSIHVSISAASGICWKLNEAKKKICRFSKGPFGFTKRASGNTSNIERNKKKNIAGFLSQNGEKEHPGGKEAPIPAELKDIWNKILGKSTI